MGIIKWLKTLFKSNYLSCDYCVNRNCVSNNSVCSECYDNGKYECDDERLDNGNDDWEKQRYFRGLSSIYG